MRRRPRRRLRLTRRGRFVVIVVVFAALGGGAWLGWRMLGSDGDGPGTGGDDTTTTSGALAEPGEIAVDYLEAWEDADWTAMAVLARDVPADFTTLHESWLADLEITEMTFTPGEPEPAASGAVVPFTAELQIAGFGPWSYEGRMGLIAGPAGWRVQWLPATIHPSLGPGESLRLERVPQERAPLLADDGTPLTVSEPLVTVGIIPERVEDRAVLAAALETQLQIPPERIDLELDRSGVQPDWFLPIVAIRAQQYAAVRPALFPVPGVAFRQSIERLGPTSGFATHILGRTGPASEELASQLGGGYRQGDDVGQYGLELVHETTLAGTPDGEIRRVDGTGEVIEVLHRFDGQEAAPVTTTISLPVQLAAERTLDAVALPAAIVAIDIDTGEVKAAVSRPLEGFNRALEGRYPPGSTFKVVTAAALLDDGLTPDTSVGCPPSTTVGGRTFSNFGEESRGTITLEEAFAHSCNTTFIDLATALEPGRLATEAADFGFDTGYDVGLPAFTGSFPEAADTVERAASAIGQARVLASPLHMAAVAAAAATGSWTPPSVIAGTGTATPTLEPGSVDALRLMMRSVVTEGTGTAADLEGFDVRGKTGTAEAGTVDEPISHSWFIGYRDDLAFAVIVENGGTGGSVAAPLAAAFLTAVDEEIEAHARRSGCVSGALEDWSTFQGSPGRHGCTDRRVVTSPMLAWTADIGVQAWLNNPVIAEGRVFVATAGRVRGSPDDRDGVYALDVSSGRELWSFAAATDVNGVAVADGVVVASGDEGTVWGLAAADGSELWSLDVGQPVFTNPLVVGDLAVVGDAAGRLHAIGLGDGVERWTAGLDGAVRGGAASDGTTIFALGESGDARAFALDGAELWRTTLMFENAAGDRLFARLIAAPTLASDLVIVSYVRDDAYPDPALIALDRFTGAERWRATDPSGVVEGWGNLRSSPAVVGRELYLGAPVSNVVAAVDVQTGEALWAVEAGAVCEPHWPSPAVVGSTIVVPRNDGAVWAIDATGRRVAWDIGITAPDFTGRDECEAAEGDPRAAIQASPAVAADGTIVVGGMDGSIYAIRDTGW